MTNPAAGALNEVPILITPDSVKSFAECLIRRSLAEPDKVVLRFFPDDGETETVETFAGLDAKARAIAAWLIPRTEPGDRVLLMYDEAPTFLAAFFGCLYAGTIAVPVFPPTDKRTFTRFLLVAQNAAAAALLHADRYSELLREDDKLSRLALPELIMNTSVFDGDDLNREALRYTAGDEVAFLQYTSGSTSSPRGVMVTHNSLLSNLGMFRHAYPAGSNATFGMWLPFQHDMGLITGLLGAIYYGNACVTCPPSTFLRSPQRFLQLLTDFGVTHSVMPNFGFELCVRKIGPQDRAKLNLEKLRVLWNSSEPIRSATLNRFSDVFAICGFSRHAICPGYGLAEATLIVSDSLRSNGPKAIDVSIESYECGAVKLASEVSNCRTVISSGFPIEPGRVKLMSIDSPTELGEGNIGEIWLSGPHITSGYWRNPVDTEFTYENRLPGDSCLWLRTGDLGFLWDGELYVTGRLKDVIIVRGRNLYPPDLEEAVADAHPMMRPGCCATFSIEVADEEGVGVACEVRSTCGADEYGAVVRAIRGALSREFNVSALAVALLAPGGTHKTSSGKFQRSSMSSALVSGKLDCLYVDGIAREKAVGSGAMPTKRVGDDATRELVRWISVWVEHRLQLVPGALSPDGDLAEQGLDSLGVVDLCVALEGHLGVKVTEAAPRNHPTPEQLAAYLMTLEGAGASRSTQQARAGTPRKQTVGALEGTLADFKELSGNDVMERTRPFLSWRHRRIREGYWPYLRLLHAAPAAEQTFRFEDGKDLDCINLGSIDYLGLSGREEIKEAAIQAVRDYGPHSASVPVFSGGSLLARQLEDAVAEHLQSPDVLLFPTGWSAGWGSVAGLIRERDHVVLDLLAHNCLQQGARAATRNIRHFGHLDTGHAERILADIRGRDAEAGILVVSEGLFSMDSDWPELAALQEVCQCYDARLLVDVSHDLGSMGPLGTGQIGLQGLLGKIDLVVGGFSKTLAANGGFLACRSAAVKEYLKVYADSNLFATAISPVAAGAAMAALRIARSAEGEALRGHLSMLGGVLRDGLAQRGIECGGALSPLVPVIVGKESAARLACSHAIARGVLTNLVEYPAVPVGAARLRVQLTATQTREQIERVVDVLSEAVLESAVR